MKKLKLITVDRYNHLIECEKKDPPVEDTTTPVINTLPPVKTPDSPETAPDSPETVPDSPETVPVPETVSSPLEDILTLLPATARKPARRLCSVLKLKGVVNESGEVNGGNSDLFGLLFTCSVVKAGQLLDPPLIAVLKSLNLPLGLFANKDVRAQIRDGKEEGQKDERTIEEKPWAKWQHY